MINRLLTVTLIIAVLLFGSVEIWSSAAIQFLVFTAGLLWVLRREYLAYEIPVPVRLLFVTVFTFLAYGTLQALPLPAPLIKVLSPLSFQMQSFYSVETRSMMTISLNAYGTVYDTIKGFAFLTVFAISAASFSDRDEVNRTLKILTIFGFSLAVFAIVQKAAWNNGIYWVRNLTLGGSPFGPFVNRNHFAGLMDMLIPLGLGLALTQQKREKKILFGFLTVIMAVSLFFSLSRGGIISFFAGITLFTLLMLQRDRGSRKIWLIGFFVAVVLSYVIYLGVDPIIERFYKTDVSGEERLVVWSATWNAVRDFWLTGAGLGSFLGIFLLYSPPSIQGGIYDHAHNDYLEFFLETGLVGAVFLLTFLSLMIYMVMKTPLRGRSGLLRTAAISSVFTMMVHSIFDFNLHILSNMLVFASVLGMVAGLSGMKEDEEKGGIPLTKKKTRGEQSGKMTAAMLSRSFTRRKRTTPLFEDIETGESKETASIGGLASEKGPRGGEKNV